MREPYVARFQNRQIGVVHPDGVRRDGAAIPDAEVVEGFGGCRVAFGQIVVILFFGLGEVNHERRIVLVGQRAGGLQGLVGIGVQRVRRHGGGNQRIVVEALQVTFRVDEGIGGSLVVGHRGSR